LFLLRELDGHPFSVDLSAIEYERITHRQHLDRLRQDLGLFKFVVLKLRKRLIADKQSIVSLHSNHAKQSLLFSMQ